MIKGYLRNKAIKSYIKKLPKMLAKDYGKSKTYTPMQVKRTVERNGLSVPYVYHAMAMYCPKGEFDSYHLEMGENCNYQNMRSTIAAQYFNGAQDFSVSDVGSVSVSMGGGFDTGGYSSSDMGSGGND